MEPHRDGSTPPRQPGTTRGRRHAAPRSRRSGAGSSLVSMRLLVACAVAIAIAIAVVVAYTLLFSPAKRDQRDIESSLRSLGSVSSFEEFSDKICTQFRPDPSVVQELGRQSQQSGFDFDAYFTQQIKQSFPSSLSVEKIDKNGDDVRATVESTDPQGVKREEQVQMRREDGSWKVCDPAVGDPQQQVQGN